MAEHVLAGMMSWGHHPQHWKPVKKRLLLWRTTTQEQVLEVVVFIPFPMVILARYLKTYLLGKEINIYKFFENFICAY